LSLIEKVTSSEIKDFRIAVDDGGFLHILFLVVLLMQRLLFG